MPCRDAGSEEYGHHAFFGAPLELVRKLLLTSLSLFFDSGNPVQVLYATVVSFGAAVVHAAFKPFAHNRRAYWLQVSRRTCDITAVPASD